MPTNSSGGVLTLEPYAVVSITHWWIDLTSEKRNLVFRIKTTGRIGVKTKKLINDGAAAVDEMLAGILAAHPHHLRAVEGSPRSIIANEGRGQARSA